MPVKRAAIAVPQTGTYVGDGTNSRRVAHTLGRQPVLVVIHDDTAPGDLWLLHYTLARIYDIFVAGMQSGVVPAGTSATEIPVSEAILAVGPNINLHTYRWVAW